MKSCLRIFARASAIAFGFFGPGLDPVRSECPILNFDSLTVGTAVTNQLPGVTFSVLPQTCSGLPTLYMRVFAPTNGTSSGTRCLKIDGGCPDFSDDYLRMVFDRAQSEVSFTVGDWATTYVIRSYSTVSGAGLIGTLSVVIPPSGGGDVGVHRRVTVVAAAGNMRRIEVQGATSNFEAIDDLTYNADSTAPVAQILSPAQLDCVCNGITLTGSAYDPDGDLVRWQLHRKALGVTTWTLIRSSTIAVTNGSLGAWSTAADDGYYTLRLTAENECGLQTIWTTDVYLDRTFNSLALRSPVDGQLLGGMVCADGTAWDHCSGTLAVARRPAAGGAWVAFDSVAPPWVITDTLGSWDSRSVADGAYQVRVVGTDVCGNAGTNQVGVAIDNTAPTALITAPTVCASLNGVIEIRGTATDANLQNWILQYAGDGVRRWTTIASNTTAVVNGRLALWNTAGLEPCAYAVRLVVTDRALVNCDASLHNQTEDVITLRLVGDLLFQDTDGDGMPDVWENAHRLDPNNANDAAKDADADGQTNLEEYLAGTDPWDPLSRLAITRITLADEDVRVAWTAAESRHYQLLSGTNVWAGITNVVSPLISIPPGGPSETNYLHRGGAAPWERFYRVRLVP